MSLGKTSHMKKKREGGREVEKTDTVKWGVVLSITPKKFFYEYHYFLLKLSFLIINDSSVNLRLSLYFEKNKGDH